ncbi:FAD-binding oxidoreductase [Lichenibacterium ramalinae]|uniref:D-2-hydroxyglutarate dehydrogenase n=1 Tax=Lichenibacterium ramalinae TaxID=2316527 RepID=A0A4Q2RA45_9HYPH|nr:FAD-binding oxidoreductase [Lichenibacterium ramalinae]
MTPGAGAPITAHAFAMSCPSRYLQRGRRAAASRTPEEAAVNEQVTTLDRDSTIAPAVAPAGAAGAALRHALGHEGFGGDVEEGIGPRLVAATDNSIYQVMPSAVLHPRTGADVVAAVRAVRAVPGLALSPRGGGTGTNGQSLTTGVVLDLSRHMNRILSLDVAAGRVVVEPGVVLDQLNAFLKPHGLFFPPAVSTATRATLGGMIATDASGKGSRLYGRTSDHVEALDVVLSDGSEASLRPLAPAEFDAVVAAGGILGEAHAEVLRVVTEHAGLIAETFPAMNRGLTGYNLQGVTRPDGRLDMIRLLAGSEGTLAVTKAATLRLTRLPRHRLLIVARYAAFDAALRDVQHLLAAEPLAIEILDDKVLELASRDVIWTGLEAVLGGPAAAPVRGLNVIEFVGDDADALARAADRCVALLADSPHPAMDWTRVSGAAEMAQLWTLREKSVGLMGRLGAVEGSRRQGTAFVEDTAVPPERLADYVAEFRAILDRHGLGYGMYGHADVGCLHVRPSLDMADPADEAMIRIISDEVAALVKRHGGLLWGEHGRGYRGEFSPLFFGPVLYDELCRIKLAFDPDNIFNPGKLASPALGGPIDRIDAVPVRGAYDRLIDETRRAGVDRAVSCNGNAACHSWDDFDAMCPSYHATRDRVQSPKGRATLLRAWARLSAEAERGRPVAAELAAVEAETKASLDTCLSCKACASLCPVKVDVPTMRSRFLARYYANRPRPRRDRLLRHLEAGLALVRHMPALASIVMRLPLAVRLLRDGFGLVDLPHPAPTRWRPRPAGEGPRVVLLRDSFLGTFDGTVIDAAGRLLERLGYCVTVSDIRPNGKALQVLGLERAFGAVARAAERERSRLSAAGVPVVSLDAATGLLYDGEYKEYAEYSALSASGSVLALDGFLAEEILAGRIPAGPSGGGALDILLHCTEKTARPETAARWGAVLKHFGLDARFPKVGCCGMAGLFGHQAEQAGLSRRIFDIGWRPKLGDDPARMLATGFSCRCQTERFAGFRPRHPVEAILAHLDAAA